MTNLLFDIPAVPVPRPSSGAGLGLIIGIVAAVVGAAVVLCVILVTRKKNKGK